MIYLYLSGGLGNQLFQYAYARNMQLNTGDGVTYLASSYKTDELRDLSLNKFNIASDWIGDASYDFWENHQARYFYYRLLNKLDRVRNVNVFGDLPTDAYIKTQNKLFKKGIHIHDNHAYITPSFACRAKDKYIRGLWHHPMFFDGIREKLLEELRLKDVSALPQELLSRVEKPNSVCVHIRRGDYLNYSHYIVCNIDYYIRAIEEIRKRHPESRFYIFSDDIAWVKDNIGASQDVFFVEERHPDYIDFELMRRCNHFIISNSTFSWWAAYLGNTKDKTVITPDKWYNDGRNKKQLNMSGWIEMETRLQ